MPALALRQSPLSRARGPLVTGLVGLGAAGYMYLLDPNSSGGYVICPWLAITGIYCPGCGGLRATHAMLHWDWADALSFNLLWTIGAPVLAGLWLWWLVRQLTNQSWKLRIPRVFWVSLGAVIAIFWVLRNIPSLGQWLAPV